MFRSAAVTFPILAFTCSVSLAGAVENLTPVERVFPELSEFLEAAAETSPRMLEEALRVEEAREEAGIARAARYPSVRGTGRLVSRYEERSDLDSGRGGFLPQATLTLRQPLYHWGALRAEDRIGRIREELASHNSAEAFRLLALEVRSRYLRLALDGLELEVADRRRELADREWRTGRRMLERGEIEETALRDLALALEEAELALERLKAERDRSRRTLARLVGYDPTRAWEGPGVIPRLQTGGLMEGNDSLPADRSRPPFLEAADHRVREAERRRETERTRARPNLDFVAGVSQDQVAVLDRRDIDRTIFFAGVEVNWNIFDGFETRSRRAAASTRLRLEERRRGRLETEWRDDLDDLENRLRFRAREMRVADERLALAEDFLERDRADFEAGRLSATELAHGEVLAAERRFAAGELRAAYLMAWAELVSESGRDPVVRDFVRNR